MRKMLLLVPFLFACTKAEKPQAETAAAAAPMALTEADVAGTWMGTMMPTGSDSVVANWTATCGTGICKLVVEGSPDTVAETYTLSGDSAIGQAPAHKDQTGTMVTDSWVLRIADGKVTGTGTSWLAEKPDSAVMHYHFSGSRM
jgi:hypothetical protein